MSDGSCFHVKTMGLHLDRYHGGRGDQYYRNREYNVVNSSGMCARTDKKSHVMHDLMKPICSASLTLYPHLGSDLVTSQRVFFKG